MKPQHLLLMALAGLGLGGAWYVLAAQPKKSESKKGGTIDIYAPGYHPQSSFKQYYETEQAKYQAVLEIVNKQRQQIQLAPGVSFDEQGKMHYGTMPILVANPVM